MAFRERGTEAVIHTAHLSHNLAQFKQLHTGPIIAVVKADAYGHGLAVAVEHLQQADAFAVATIEEAMAVRQVAPKHRIILLEGVFNQQELLLSIEQRFDVVIHQHYQVALLNQAPASGNLDVWLKIDTGMSRLGFPPAKAEALLQQLNAAKVVNTIRVMSHFASSDHPDSTQTQSQQTQNDWLKSLGYAYSLSNTGAVMNHLSDPSEWTRVGIGLYGISPIPEQTGSDFKLLPVMELSAKLIATKTIPAGARVGYGGTYVASEDMKIGIVGIGYADGYPWTERQSQVMIHDTLVPVIGRVSMDMLAINLQDMPAARTGDRVLLWGHGLPIEQVAADMQLIPYTLPCGITKRVNFHVIQ
jgi:alanine racemase